MQHVQKNHALRSNLFRWSSELITNSTLVRPQVITKDLEGVAAVRGRIDAHDERIANHRLLPNIPAWSSFRPGMGRQFASHVNRLLTHVACDLVTSSRTSAWTRNRALIQGIAQRFYFDAGSRPVFLWAHRLSWDHEAVLSGGVGVRTLRVFEGFGHVRDGREPCTLFESTAPLPVQLGAFEWEPVDGLSEQRDGFFRFTRSEMYLGDRRPVTNGIREVFGLGAPGDVDRTEGGTLLAPAYKAHSAKALWRDSAWTPRVLEHGAKPDATLTKLGYVSADQSINLWRLFRMPGISRAEAARHPSRGVMNEYLGFQLHPFTGRLMQVSTNINPFAVVHGADFEHGAMGRFAAAV